MSSRSAFRIKSAYFALFSSFGIFVVYLNLHFRRIGLSSEQIGILSALYPLVGLALNPFWGMMADRSKDPRRLVMGLVAISGILFFSMMFTHNFGLLFILLFTFAAFYSPNVSLIDALTLSKIAASRENYGRLRLWGSLGFIFPAFILGLLFRWGVNLKIIFPSFLILILITLIAFRRFPLGKRVTVPHLASSVLLLLKQPMVLFFFITGFLQNLSMSGYYSFFSIYLDELKINDAYLGLIWAIGPIAEIFAFMIVHRWIARLGLKRLLLISHAVTVFRLGVLSTAPWVGVIVGTQFLHAFSYGTMHSGNLYFLTGKAGDHNRASIQGLYNAICVQFSMVVGHILAGYLVQRYGLFTMFRTCSVIALVTTVLFGIYFREKRSE